MKQNLFLSVAIVTCIIFTSCYGTRIMVGEVSSTSPVVKVQSAWNHHFIYGLVPAVKTNLRAEDYVGDAENYVVKTNISFINGLISLVTYGIYTPSQTKFYIPVSDLKIDKK